MRIALFHNLPSGGAKRAVHEWTRRLASRHDIDVYTMSTADHGFCDIRPLVRAHEEYPFTPSRMFSSPIGRINQLQRWRDLGRLAALGRRIAACVDARGYDVVFANTCRFTFVPTLLQFVQCPAVYFLHEPFGRALHGGLPSGVAASRTRVWLDPVDPLIRLYRRRLDHLQRAALARTSLLANSCYTATCMTEGYGVGVPTCRLGVDADTFSPSAKIPRGSHVLSVGELSPRKGFGFIVESLGHIPAEERPPLRIACNVVVPDERTRVERLAAALCVQLEIRAGLDTAEIVREYNESALCVYAPVNEPFGLVPLEAMACGTAVVAVREGGVAESVVNDETGLLVSRDARWFAQAVRSMLSNPEVLDRFGRNGRAHVSANWTWERSADELDRHLRGVAKRANRAA